ncbi:PREDICTED: uridine phosphorylase 2 [Thamnophis sirtalis]|uniref:Uridine phosphorylase 2 n=1 Tax=Thamnophis sirtalis TaxID=35019 RepID=A0A6I9X4N2_9SAUR|nr:PREDICTED: uridine phosphorylase 2 [Thamnophis sirtalis]
MPSTVRGSNIYWAIVTISYFFITMYFQFLGVEPGSVVITDVAVDSFFKPQFEQVILDCVVTRSTELDQDLASELLECSRGIKDFPALMGHTMCTYDFYEGKLVFKWLWRWSIIQVGVVPKVLFKRQLDFLGFFPLKMFRFSSKTLKLNSIISAAVVCVTLLNRLEGDQIKASHEVLAEYQRRPQQLIATLIKKRLGLIKDKELLDNAVV